MEIKTIFNDFAKTFEKKIDKNYSIRLQFEIKDMPNDIWQVDVQNVKVKVFDQNKITVEETLIISKKDILIKLYNNQLSPLTAFLQRPEEKGEMLGALIITKSKPTEEDFINRLLIFQHFFSKEYPTKVILSKRNGVEHNNVNTIGLSTKFIGKRHFIQAYFSIKNGETLKQPAFEFSVYVINGEGTLTVGSEEYKIESKNYYSLEPKSKISIKNNKDKVLEIIYISNT